MRDRQMKIAIPIIVLLVMVLGVGGYAIWTMTADPVDAQTVIQDACAGSEDVQSRSVALTGSQLVDGKVVMRFAWEVQVNGSDSLTTMRNVDTVEKSEHYIVGGKSYMRQMNLSGEWSDWLVRPFDVPDPQPTGPVARVDDSPVVFCGLDVLTDHKFTGNVQLSGQTVKHFTASVDDDAIDADWQFWIDDSGKMRQFQVDETHPDNDKLEAVATFSYPTTPITITAPTVP